jgi:hypothetical protein
MFSNLTPRKGHFSFSPWQRHGNAMGKPSPKKMRPERAPEHAGSIRKSGFIMVRPLEGENTPVIIESWYHTEKPDASGAWASRRVPFGTSQDYSIF